jgi:hypothetical protein
MSARQRERLRREEELSKQLKKVEEAEEDSEEDEEEEIVAKKKAFVFSDTSSSSSSSSDEKEESGEKLDTSTTASNNRDNNNSRKNKKFRKKKTVNTSDENEEEESEAIRLAREAKERQDAEDAAFLDAVIATKQIPASSQAQPAVGMSDVYSFTDSAFLSLQDVDIRMLDMDAWIRQRFTGMQDTPLEGGGPHRGFTGRRGQRQPLRRGIQHQQLPGNNVVNKKLYFSQQKDDWTKPPSFIAGGIGMQKVPVSSDATGKLPYTMYSFEWSKEYKQLQVIYEVVQHLGDPNYLVMFLANNPYHVEGFLELGMIFLRSGHVEKGLDCIRRCIFIYECFSFDPFPLHPLQARMDPTTAENRPYFQALFRYMQISSRQGYHILAADIARILLSLNPMDDLLGLLLMLDALLLQAGKYEVILQLCGVQLDQLVGEQALSTVERAEHWQRAYLIDSHISSEDASESRNYTVAELANWWYSLALATYLWIQKREQQRRFAPPQHSSAGTNSAALPEEVPSMKVANALLQQALERYPFVLEALLPRVEAPAKLVQQVKSHPYVQAAQQSLPFESFVHRLTEGYVLKQEHIWTQKSDAVEWLLQQTAVFLQRTEPSAASTNPNNACSGSGSSGSNGSGIKGELQYPYVAHILEISTSLLQDKYANIPLEDFQEDFNRLPADLQAIDEDLLDPRVLGGGARFPKLHQQLLAMKSIVKRNQRVAWFYNQEQQHQAKQRQGLFSMSVLIDLTRPLLQLFLLTLLPWIAVPRYQRPRR